MDWDNDQETVATLRKFVELQSLHEVKDPAVQEETIQIPARDGFGLPTLVFRSEADAGGSPRVIVLFYGGGNILGQPVMMAKLARSLVKQFGVTVLAPTYRLAPEHPFPAAVNDGWDALSWISGNAESLKIDPRQGFIVGGISAGGNIANVITHLARDRGLRFPITGVWLSVPAVRLAPNDAKKLPQKYTDRMISHTQEAYINSPTLPPGMRRLIDRCNKRDEKSQLASPLVWHVSSDQDRGEFGHKGMPRTYSQVCGADTGRDGLLIYDDMLKNEGVATRLDIYAGLPHVFWHSFKRLSQAKKWEQDTLDGFEWLLAG